jgi:hypothetical protein
MKTQTLKFNYRGFIIYVNKPKGVGQFDYTVTIEGESTVCLSETYAQYLIDLWYIDEKNGRWASSKHV